MLMNLCGGDTQRDLDRFCVWGDVGVPDLPAWRNIPFESLPHTAQLRGHTHGASIL